MEETLAALALSGGSAVVGAMATDTWAHVRARVLALFGRDRDRQAAMAAQLETGNDLVTRSDDADRVRAALVPAWQLLLERLLADAPEQEEALRSLVADLAATRPGSQHWEQNVTARDNARVYAAQGGDVHVHHDGPDRVTPPGGNDGNDR